MVTDWHLGSHLHMTCSTPETLVCKAQVQPDALLVLFLVPGCIKSCGIQMNAMVVFCIEDCEPWDDPASPEHV